MKINEKEFKEIIESVIALVPECRINLTETGMQIRAVDTANVAMVMLDYNFDAENEYKNPDKIIGVDLNRIKSMTTMIPANEEININLSEDESKLEFSFGKFNYTSALLDTNTIRKEPNPPNLPLPGTLKTSGSKLSDAIKAASIVSDKITFGINPELHTFYMDAKGTTDQINLDVQASDLKEFIPADARSVFSIDYLKDISKVISKSDEVEINIGTNFPIKFKFRTSDGKGKIEYLLAPRIEE